MRLLIVLLAAGFALAPLPVMAQTATCRINVTGLTFAPYRSLDRSPVTSIGRIDVICPGGGAGGVPRVTLSAGGSGNHIDRTMTSGAAELHYNLYVDSTRRRVLGDGTAGTTPLPPPRTRAFGIGTWAIFGAIAPGQRVPAGDYSDTLLIEVAF